MDQVPPGPVQRSKRCGAARDLLSVPSLDLALQSLGEAAAQAVIRAKCEKY